ncbi:MAG: DUF4230 domain-containing protein [Chloroflexaceae bacterium]|nr:DUF4230 domain-containing protein [Chloroflexaceae bacterium]NJO07007.1 DUF4230 domain-containing protein [Chloroflexaceae bacterium]
MSHPDEYDDDLTPRERRERLMQRRMRRVDDDDEYDDEYDDAPRRRESLIERRRRARAEYYDDDDSVGLNIPPATGRSGAGCAQTTLYLVVGGLLALVVVLFFFSNTMNNVASFFTGTPQLPELVASPTPTIRTDSAAVIERIQGLSRLETTSYTIEKVIEAGIEGNAFENLLFGDRLLLIAQGTVLAGIDLSTLTTEDVIVSPDGAVVTITLPPVQIFDVTLDNDATRVYDRQQGFFASPDRDLETEARQAAEREILAAACEGGILQRATDDSQRAMEQFLSLLDVDEVIVRAAPVPVCPSS